MNKQHIILYIPGLGDKNLSGRQEMLNTWHFKGISIEVCPMDWTVDEPWQTKLDRLLTRIDACEANGYTVSLVGESAGASAAIQALAQKTDKLHAVILLCGKTQYPERVAPIRYQINPAFKDALAASDNAVKTLTEAQKKLILNLHPLFDPVVPVSETKISGVKDVYMPIIGHATGIVFANLLWSWRIVRFVRSLS